MLAKCLGEYTIFRKWQEVLTYLILLPSSRTAIKYVPFLLISVCGWHWLEVWGLGAECSEHPDSYQHWTLSCRAREILRSPTTALLTYYCGTTFYWLGIKMNVGLTEHPNKDHSFGTKASHLRWNLLWTHFGKLHNCLTWNELITFRKRYH